VLTLCRHVDARDGEAVLERGPGGLEHLLQRRVAQLLLRARHPAHVIPAPHTRAGRRLRCQAGGRTGGRSRPDSLPEDVSAQVEEGPAVHAEGVGVHEAPPLGPSDRVQAHLHSRARATAPLVSATSFELVGSSAAAYQGGRGQVRGTDDVEGLEERVGKVLRGLSMALHFRQRVELLDGPQASLCPLVEWRIRPQVHLFLPRKSSLRLWRLHSDRRGLLSARTALQGPRAQPIRGPSASR
jgi:hypothetical protein